MNILTHPLCAEHLVPEGHPERPDRITSLIDHLRQTGLTDDYPLLRASSAAAEDILRAHPAAYLGELESLKPDSGVIPVDPDTWLSPHSLDAALVAAGSVCDGVSQVMAGETSKVFCAVRPPGHHAEREGAMGFCLYNSIAIGALKALTYAGIDRVAVLDFDVHHGNGTVDIFRNQPQVLVCSSFQHPYYPNRMHDVDAPNIVHSPLPAGSGSNEFRAAIERDWLPALERHQPQFIFISAGFDAHASDPLANLNLSTQDFTWVTELIRDSARQYAQGRVVSALEGGYDLNALAASVTAHLEALAQN